MPLTRACYQCIDLSRTTDVGLLLAAADRVEVGMSSSPGDTVWLGTAVALQYAREPHGHGQTL